MKKQVAVILSGCGVFDGAEIHESVLILLHLAQAGAEVTLFAPNTEQTQVINHLTGAVMNETRNTLIEAARIARGEISDIKEAQAHHFDALIMPGGFGVAKNISNFATDDKHFTINSDVLRFSQMIHQQHKPIGLLCIAPILATKICGPGVQCTIGNDIDTAKFIKNNKGIHINCQAGDICIDKEKKLVTTPAYMLAQDMVTVFNGIQKLIAQVLALIKQ